MADKEESLFARLNPRRRAYLKKQKLVEDYVSGQFTAAREVDLSYGKIPQEKVPDMVLAGDMEKIRLTLEQLDAETFRQAVDTILSAETIYILGIRSCAPLASFLSFYLHQIFPDVRLLATNSANEILEQLIRIGEKDVLIGISFPRYSMRTLKAMEFANSRNARTVAITDDVHSPLNLYSSCYLIARSEMVSIVDSLTAPMSVINALVVALCMQRQKEAARYLRDLDRSWEEFQIYSHDEIDPVTEQVDMALISPEKTAGNGAGLSGESAGTPYSAEKSTEAGDGGEV